MRLRKLKCECPLRMHKLAMSLLVALFGAQCLELMHVQWVICSIPQGDLTCSGINNVAVQFAEVQNKAIVRPGTTEKVRKLIGTSDFTGSSERFPIALSFLMSNYKIATSVASRTNETMRFSWSYTVVEVWASCGTRFSFFVVPCSQQNEFLRTYHVPRRSYVQYRKVRSGYETTWRRS